MGDEFSQTFKDLRSYSEYLLIISNLYLSFKHETTVIRYFSWIFDYLTNRLQYVRLNGLLSSAISTNTGAPQGTILAPFYVCAVYS